jgi:hypothetical protein
MMKLALALMLFIIIPDTSMQHSKQRTAQHSTTQHTTAQQQRQKNYWCA